MFSIYYFIKPSYIILQQIIKDNVTMLQKFSSFELSGWSAITYRHPHPPCLQTKGSSRERYLQINAKMTRLDVSFNHAPDSWIYLT